MLFSGREATSTVDSGETSARPEGADDLWADIVGGGQDLLSASDERIARRLVELARSGNRAELDWLFRPDRSDAPVRFSIQCRRTGSPRANGEHLVDDSVLALQTLVDCGMDDHVAADLVVRTQQGDLEWLVMSRDGDDVAFHFASVDSLRGDTMRVAKANEAWNRFLLSDAPRPAALPDRDGLIDQLRSSLQPDEGAARRETSPVHAAADAPAVDDPDADHGNEPLEPWSVTDEDWAAGGPALDLVGATDEDTSTEPAEETVASDETDTEPDLEPDVVEPAPVAPVAAPPAPVTATFDPSSVDADAVTAGDVASRSAGTTSRRGAWASSTFERAFRGGRVQAEPTPAPAPAPAPAPEPAEAPVAEASSAVPAPSVVDAPVTDTAPGGRSASDVDDGAPNDGARDRFDLEWVSLRLGRVEVLLETFGEQVRTDVRSDLRAAMDGEEANHLRRHRNQVDEIDRINDRLDDLTRVLRRLVRAVDPTAMADPADTDPGNPGSRDADARR